VVVDGQGMRCDDGTPSRARSKLLGLWSFTEERARIDGWEVKHAKIARGVGASLLLTAQDFQSYSHALREFEFQLVGDMQLAFDLGACLHKYHLRAISLLFRALDWLRIPYVLRCWCRYLRRGAGTRASPGATRGNCRHSPSE
jgi:hypothetical protein